MRKSDVMSREVRARILAHPSISQMMKRMMCMGLKEILRVCATYDREEEED
jgi:hypothetical protein